MAGRRRVAPSRSPLFQGEESGPGESGRGRALGRRFLSSHLTRGEVGRGVPRWRAVGGRAAGHPPRPPFQGGEKVGGARPRPGDSYVGEVPDALTFWLLPPFRGEVGRGEESGQGDRIWKFCDGSEASVSPGGRAPLPSSLLPPFRGEVGRGVPRRRAVGGRAAGHPPRPPFQGGEKVGGARPRPGDSYVGEVPDALTFWLLPPSGGRSGGGSRRWVRRRARAIHG